MKNIKAKQLIDKLEMQLELNESPSVVSLCNIFLQKLKTFKLDRFKIIVDGHRFELDGQGKDSSTSRINFEPRG